MILKSSLTGELFLFYSSMCAKHYSFGKAERLKSRKQIESLFRQGKRFSLPGLMVYYRFATLADGEKNLLSGVTVSSRHFRKAVARNRVKRMLREVLRLQKDGLEQQLQQKGMHLHLFLLYTGKTLPAYNALFTQCSVALQQLQTLANEMAQANP